MVRTNKPQDSWTSRRKQNAMRSAGNKCNMTCAANNCHFAWPSVEVADWRAMWHVPMGCATPVHLIRYDLLHFLKYLILY